jgi:DNA-binding response OmpR family regulator
MAVMKVLIYEHNRDNKKIILDILNQLDVSYKFASLLEDIVYLNLEYAPDIIILNMSQEDEEDYSIISEIKKLEFIKYTFIIVLTAKGGIDIGNMCLTAGADDFIDQKFIETELIHRVLSGESVVSLFQ